MALIQGLFPSARNNDPFIDAYVLTLPFLPVLLMAGSALPAVPLLTFLLGTWRVFEVLVFLSNTYLFDDYRARMRGEEPKPFGGIRRVLILTGVNYIELILWFAAFYRILIPELSQPGLEYAVNAVNFSFVTMSAFGTTNVQPPGWVVTVVAIAQSALGLAMALAVIARSVSLLPRRKTGDPLGI